MIFEVEKWLKGKVFDCQACGQCLLSHTKLICPMNCPKGLRNGPCGGTLNGKCEVLPEMDCVWTRIESKKATKSYQVHAPFDPTLLNTASYVNWITGRARPTTVPQPKNQGVGISATSKLAKKMERGDPVITLEIASPRTEEGLDRIRRVLERTSDHVDAVNTTTNAGGVPSLHSTRTAMVVQEYGVEPIVQFCGRDADLPDFLAQFSQALEQGVENYLLLTGDWLPQNERQVEQGNWFPMDSSQMVYHVNAALDQFRRSYGKVPYIGVAANPFSTPMSISVDRLRLKREAGARFCQTQAVTNPESFGEWYAQVRHGRESEPKLTIVSVPLVGSRRAFEILCRLPGVYVDPSLHTVMESDDFARNALDWAFYTAEQVVAKGAAGIHAMNFGMRPELIDEFLVQIRDRLTSVKTGTEKTVGKSTDNIAAMAT